ncbi:MAG: quinolinate synthase NadA [Verrucomicrobia bacterium]|nr:quinolinate synthase NadA [Verrucomicrobiota bacterium]
METLAPPVPSLKRLGSAFADCLEVRPARPPETTGRLQREVLELKKKRNAIVLAHNYQTAEIQDVADFVGDSLGLSYQAAKTSADAILFCGVHFMAETAKIVNPSRTVLIPDLNAGCSLADSCEAEDLEAYRKKHPDTYVVSYINCTAAVKALSDVICTSGNAVKIVNHAPKDRSILFLPDENLGQWVMEKTGRKMELWRGACHTHAIFTSESLQRLRAKHPDAPVVAHPECVRAVRLLADHICSTEGMVKFCRENPADTIIVVTESGILHRLRREAPGKTFIPGPTKTCSCNDCGFMKMNTLEKLLETLETMNPEITLDEEIRRRAFIPLQRMLEISAQP